MEHRLEVVRRRSAHELETLRHRGHIREGLLLALAHLDEVIAIIRRSRRIDTARANLRKHLKLSPAQAQAILDMPLRRLAALERKRLAEEHKAVKKRMQELEKLRASPAALREAVAQELLALKARYADPRRTRLSTHAHATAPVWVVSDAQGRLARRPAGAKPKTWGREAVAWDVQVQPNGAVLAVNEDGTAVVHAVGALSEAEAPTQRVTGGTGPLAGLLPVPAGEEARSQMLLTVAARGRVKATAWEALPGPGSQAFTLMRLAAPNERVVAVLDAPRNGEVLLFTRAGKGIRFAMAEVRPQGLAAGV